MINNRGYSGCLCHIPEYSGESVSPINKKLGSWYIFLSCEAGIHSCFTAFKRNRCSILLKIFSASMKATICYDLFSISINMVNKNKGFSNIELFLQSYKSHLGDDIE